MMLAIAADDFGKPSETFIRDHVRMLAPGATMLIARAAGGTEVLGCPALVLRGSPSSALWRAASAVRNRLRSTPLATRLPRLSESELAEAVAFLSQHRPDALLAEFGPTGVAFAPAAAIAGVPLFVHFHGSDATVLPDQPRFREAYLAMFRDAEGIIVTTEFMRGRLLDLGCPASKLSVVPCGVDTDRFAPGQERGKPTAILMVSRLIPQKGPTLAIEGFAKLHARWPDARLEIIGDGPLHRRARARARRLRLGDSVVFHGSRPHEFVLQRMRAASLLIQHCVTVPGGGVEAFGLSIVEAMACGLPVVATRHGGMRETVCDGETGLLVEERDTDGMAAAMAALLADPERAAAMGRAGRARVLEHYTHEKARDRLRAIMGLSALPTDAAPSAATK